MFWGTTFRFCYFSFRDTPKTFYQLSMFTKINTRINRINSEIEKRKYESTLTKQAQQNIQELRMFVSVMKLVML